MTKPTPQFKAKLPRGATVHALWVLPLIGALVLWFIDPWKSSVPLSFRAKAAMEAQRAQEAERAGTAAAKAGAVMSIGTVPASAPASR